VQRLPASAWPFLAGLIATYILTGFPRLHFTEPVSLAGDHLFLLDMIKDSINGVGVYNEYLGAPSHQTLFYFPLFDGSYKLLIWLFSSFTSNVFLVVSLFYLTSIGLIFTSCFWSLRTQKIGPWLASVASVVFVMSPYLATVRAFGHDLLTMYYGVPMGAALALLLSRGDVVRRALSPFAVCAVLLAGTSGLYYGFFTAMFLGVAMAGRSISERRLAPLVVLAAIAAALLLLLLSSAYSYHMWRWLIGGAGLPSPPVRLATEQLYHGLLISSAMHVYSDIGLFTQKFAQYWDMIWVGPHGMAELVGEAYMFEWPGAFLTTIILAAPVMLFGFIGSRTPRATSIALCCALITFGLLFAMRGGLGYAFNFIFIGAIRAQQRILPFLSFYAIVIVCLGCGELRPGIHRAAVSAVAACLLLTGIYPALQYLPRRQQAFLNSAQEQANRQSVVDVLAAKDRAGITTVFQLPVMQWPEPPPQNKLDGESHILPYVMDKAASKTRWSYGLSATEILPFVALTAVDEDIPSKAKAAGFDGILVEKRGYAAERAARLLASLQENGGCIRHEDKLRALLSICR
jgi:hypothetical protein